MESQTSKLRVQARAESEGLRCPWCHDDLNLDGAMDESQCRDCHSWMHRDCAALAGKCPNLGCQGELSNVPEQRLGESSFLRRVLSLVSRIGRFMSLVIIVLLLILMSTVVGIGEAVLVELGLDFGKVLGWVVTLFFASAGAMLVAARWRWHLYQRSEEQRADEALREMRDDALRSAAQAKRSRSVSKQ